MEKYYKLYFCRIFVNKMIQLRSLLIYVCTQRKLIETAKILISMNKIHLKFISNEKPTEKQINQFWLVYGCLLVHKRFDFFDKWKEILDNNISELNPNDCIDSKSVNQNQIPGRRLLAGLRNLTQNYDPLQLGNNLEVWQQKECLFNSKNLTNIPGMVKNIINQRIQNILLTILQFKKKLGK
ncbi:hypothetical protein TUBRATIS_000230 [Tubulinosema ratisbonensis]|uniref:Uncharacterized protein n=1 Tax=Tubulinosema ratisbonensis TaxID=291195 RepID=A0A437AQC2_9MICR|nr:hypothetical protein TUBRATIS_000230 [Tubulinosema ratisbonensis]